MKTDTEDKRVSNAYRDLASEQTPAELDEKILALAASEARTRYGFTRAWIRPVAWAATIGLSLAFLLEMSQVNEVPVLPDTPVPIAEEGPTRDEASKDAFATENLDLLQEAEEQARMQGGEARAIKTLADEPAAASLEATAVQKAAAPAKREMKTAHCDEEARRSADRWYECVLALRDQGRAEAAASELEALVEAFPGFREPAPQ